ncbi:PIN2/TERF1-interacting telomerase inhibitor 1 [Blomia tropicalis]|nr:PIN2/TERF1-interacting telomerase inhibitor 1 [Blomia tropicalis]
MLAERKRKVIYSTNPRGLDWVKDNNKFGQRMLQSMGWKNGQGLGKNNDGITENIKASFKFCSKGLGYQPKTNQWVEENNVYEQLLSELAEQHGTQPKQAKSSDMEMKIKKSGRLQKFIKAKNLSTKSEIDVFQIFPTTSKRKVDESEVEKEQNEGTEETISEPKIQTIESKLSIEDYFKQKMNSIKSISTSDIKLETQEDVTKKSKKKRKHQAVDNNE